MGEQTAAIDEFAPDTNRIITVANVAKKRGRPPKPKEQPKQEIKAVVVDVLKGTEVEATRTRLRTAFIGLFKAMDDFMNLTFKEKPLERVMIWTMIDDHDIEVLVNARITRAQHSVFEARAVRAFLVVYEQFASGFITLPRMWQTYVAYQMYGFELPGAEFRKKRRNLRLVRTDTNH